MQITVTNASGARLFLPSFYVDLAASGTVTTRRNWADLDADYNLKALLAAGTVTITWTREAGDLAQIPSSVSPKSWTNVLRPAANTVPPFTVIWNSDDNAYNVSDGTSWRDMDGIVT